MCQEFIGCRDPDSRSVALILQEDSFKAGSGKTKRDVRPSRPKHYLPERDDGKVGEVTDRFEVAPEAEVDTSVTYGLNIKAPRSKVEPSTRDALSVSQSDGGDAAQSSQRDGQNGASVTSRDWETKAFHVSS
jgi:hypothetical protein